MAVPSMVKPAMDALDAAWGLPFSRPMPRPDAWEGMVMAAADLAADTTAAVRPTRAARRVVSSLAARTVTTALAFWVTGALAWQNEREGRRDISVL